MTLVEELTDKLSCPTGSTLKKTHDSLNYTEGYIDCLEKAIKIVENHSDWIPASKPPRKEGEYNVTSKSFKETKTMYYSLSRNEWYFENGIYDDVIAWQPLPKPYKGE